VRGINPQAVTPEWMVRRLERSGLRSIGAVVDVTNYVLLELGQPLHAFDLSKLAGGIEVRYAKAGEQLKLLNEQTATLGSNMLVIADAKKALALAGVMGGMESAVSDGTADIFLESAFFAPEVIAGRARSLGLSTDSSHRFERGVDFAATRECLERATALVLEICGGTAGPVTDVTGELPKRPPVMLRKARARRLLGINISDESIESLLSRLQFSYVSENGHYFVTPPSYRFDISIEADLIEEVARLHGYDNIPATLPKAGLALLPRPEASRNATELKTVLVAHDYQEIVTYSFVDAAWEVDFAGAPSGLVLQNPIASQMGVMRSTLFGGLIETLRYNLNRRQERVRLFEVGRCFEKGDDALRQPLRVAGLCHGAARSEQWGEAARPVDFFDAKADVEALLYPQLGRFVAAPHPALHPGQSAQVWLGERMVGWMGLLHPQLQQKYDLSSAPVLFELELDELLTRRVPAYSEVSKFPPVRRDLAVIVDESTSVQTLLDGLNENPPAIVTGVELFDVYRGKGIDSGKKSLAFRVLMQDTQKTLTDEEVDGAVASLTRLLSERFDAKLRN
jgi:phenylalanyl-tRNA synthetase beta chain